MPDKTVFYVYELDEEGSTLYDAASPDDAWAQHCTLGLADPSERDEHAIDTMLSADIDAIRSMLEAHHNAILLIVLAHRKGEPLDALIEAAAGVIDV